MEKKIFFSFSLQLSHRKILTGLDAGLDGKIFLAANNAFSQSDSCIVRHSYTIKCDNKCYARAHLFVCWLHITSVTTIGDQLLLLVVTYRLRNMVEHVLFIFSITYMKQFCN